MPFNPNPPVCSCRNHGEVWFKDGVGYVSRDPSCRIHSMTLSRDTIPASVETVVGNWVNREKVDE